MTEQTRVIIVDDHPMVAEGIQSILESYGDLEVVATLGNGRAAIDQLDRCGFLGLVGGIGVGVASMLSPMYISEVCPARIRGPARSLATPRPGPGQ